MDLPTGLMMTCVALFQEAETPLGHVACFGTDKEGAPDAQRASVVDSIRAAYEDFEQNTTMPAKQREGLYRDMRAVAGRFEAERRVG